MKLIRVFRNADLKTCHHFIDKQIENTNYVCTMEIATKPFQMHRVSVWEVKA